MLKVAKYDWAITAPMPVVPIPPHFSPTVAGPAIAMGLSPVVGAMGAAAGSTKVFDSIVQTRERVEWNDEMKISLAESP
jgi:hypothetical protein